MHGAAYVLPTYMTIISCILDVPAGALTHCEIDSPEILRISQAINSLKEPIIPTLSEGAASCPSCEVCLLDLHPSSTPALPVEKFPNQL